MSSQPRESWGQKPPRRNTHTLEGTGKGRDRMSVWRPEVRSCRAGSQAPLRLVYCEQDGKVFWRILSRIVTRYKEVSSSYLIIKLKVISDLPQGQEVWGTTFFIYKKVIKIIQDITTMRNLISNFLTSKSLNFELNSIINEKKHSYSNKIL